MNYLSVLPIVAVAALTVAAALYVLSRKNGTWTLKHGDWEVSSSDGSNSVDKVFPNHLDCPRYNDIDVIVKSAIMYNKEIEENIYRKLPKDQMRYAEERLMLMFTMIRNKYFDALIRNGIDENHVDYTDYQVLFAMFEYICKEHILDKFRIYFLQNGFCGMSQQAFVDLRDERIESILAMCRQLVATHYPNRLIQKVCTVSRFNAFADKEVLRMISDELQKIFDQARVIAFNYRDRNNKLDAEFKKVYRRLIGFRDDEDTEV